MAQAKISWPALLQDEFDKDADYSDAEEILEAIWVLGRRDEKLAEYNVEPLRRRQAEYDIQPMRVVGNTTAVRSYGAGTMNYRHGVFHARNVEIISPNGAILLDNGACIASESLWQSRFHLHPNYKANRSTNWRYARLGARDWTEDIQRIEQPVLLAYARSYHQYFHWLLDVVPKLWMARQAEVPDVPILAGPIQPGSYQAYTLEALGIPYDRLIMPSVPILRFDEAYLSFSEVKETLKVRPSFNNGVHHKGGWDPMYLRWINAILNRLAGKLDIKRPRRIYVDRSFATHRRLAGAQPFETFLREKGFVFLDPGQFSIVEQCALFSGAEVVVGAHGAGMTNILWCMPDRPTRVLEIFPLGLEDTGYTFISSAFGFDHTVFYCPPKNPEAGIAWADIDLDSDQAIALVRDML